MFNVERMTKRDINTVIRMAKEFYKSNAVDHNVSEKILLKTVTDACSDNPLLEGFLIKDENKIVGYSYITTLYSCECGGEVVLIEELFLNVQSRGKGIGRKFLEWVFEAYPEAVRFRLEVTRQNQIAQNLYKSLGFEELSYLQMIRDVEFFDKLNPHCIE